MTPRHLLRLPHRAGWAAAAAAPAVLAAGLGGLDGTGEMGADTTIAAASQLALYALAVVLVHRASGVLNFALVPVGAATGYAFALMVQHGTVSRGLRALCPLCFPSGARWVGQINYWVSLFAALAGAIVIGFFAWLLIARRIARASRFSATAATVFLGAALGGLGPLLFQVLLSEEQRRQQTNAAAAGWPFDLDPGAGLAWLSRPGGVLVLVASTATVALALYLRFGRFGRHLRIVEQGPDQAPLLGIGIAGMESRAWVIAAGLSGAAGITTAMYTPPSGSGAALSAALPVFAAAMIAGMRSPVLTVAAAAGIAALEQVWLERLGRGPGLPLLLFLLVAAAAVAGRERLEDSAGLNGPLPGRFGKAAAPRAGFIAAALVAAIVATAPLVLAPGETFQAAGVLIYGMVGLSLAMLWSAGGTSLGPLAVAALGALAVVRLPVPFGIDLAVAALAGAALAVALALPGLQFRAGLPPIATFAAGAALPGLLAGGPGGNGNASPGATRPSLVGVDLGDDKVFFWFILVLLISAGAALLLLRRKGVIASFVAVREDPSTAAGLGLRPVMARALCVAVSGLLAGLAGGLLAYQYERLATGVFQAGEGLMLSAWAAAGGLSSGAGAMAGAAFYGVGSMLGEPYLPFVALLGLASLGIAPVGISVAATRLRGLVAAYLLPYPPGGEAGFPNGLRHGRRVAIVARMAPGPELPRYRLPGHWQAADPGPGGARDV